MLVEHRAELEELSKHPWIYLSRPALSALDKIGAVTEGLHSVAIEPELLAIPTSR
jgi:hypothetical protein